MKEGISLLPRVENPVMAERLKYDTPVVKLALERKLLSEEQHRQCKDLLRKSKKMGLETDIEDILVRRGFLQPEELEELREITQTATKGDVFGSYRLSEMLGEGGMGKVYKAVHEFMNRTVGLKIINYNFTRDQGNVARVFQEVRALSKLRHPNIVTVYDAGKVKRRYYIAMELVEGLSLGDYVRERRFLGENEALAIIRDTAEALAHAHRQSVTHRDVKPENILLDEAGRPKLTDFGLVMHHDADHMTLTMEGVMVGSLHYASPEQVEGARDIDGRSDIYSLGATLYYALTGRTLYNGKSPQQILTQHLAGNWVSPRKYRKGISRSTVKLLRSMLAVNRDKRFGTMEEVLKALGRNSPWKAALRMLKLAGGGIGLFLAGMGIEHLFGVVKILLE
jgi:serine/threonine protein kinase